MKDIAGRHVSLMQKHIRISDILTRHICSCTCICKCPGIFLRVTTYTWFPSRLWD